MMKARHFSVSFCCAALAAVPYPLFAQTDSGTDPSRGPIEEVIVTGELREAPLSRAPASISVITLAEQRSRAINHLDEILGWTPNVNLASAGSRARFVQIRGIGERGQFAEPLNPSVGLVLDGVDLSGIGTTATLFDIAQVEVLRGPQGTLYGANALGGLINVRSNDPTAEPYMEVRLDTGNYGAVGAGAVLSGPLSEQLGYRLAVQQHRDDGFTRNHFLGRDDTGERSELTARGKLQWTPRDDLTWTFAGGYIDADNGYDTFSLDNDRNSLADEPGQDRQRAGYASVQLRWDLSPAATFQGTFGGVSSSSDYGYDEDWVFDGFHPDGYSSTDRYRRERDAYSLDLRWLSGDRGRLFNDTTDWVFGVYALRQDVDLKRSYTFFAEDFTSEFEVTRLAAYGELVHAVSETTRLTLGLRAERHESEYRDSEALRFRPKDDMIGGRLVLEQDLGHSVLGYLSATRGYKAGGFNISGTLDADLREYDPEYLWNYETGLKGRWLDGRLGINAALFWMERDDLQVDTSLTRVRDDGSAEFIDLIGNAGGGSNRGVELELNYQPVEPLLLFANLGWLDTEFGSFHNELGEQMRGREQAHSPNYQFFAGAEYRFAPGWFLRVEAEGRDSFHFSVSPREDVPDRDIRSDSYVLWNASLGYTAPNWSVRLWGRNLGDEDYPTRGFYFGNDPRDGYTPRGFFQLGEPRRVGLTFTLNN